MQRVPVSPASSNRRTVGGENRASRDGKRERAKDRPDNENPFIDYSIPTLVSDNNNATISLQFAATNSAGEQYVCSK